MPIQMALQMHKKESPIMTETKAPIFVIEMMTMMEYQAAKRASMILTVIHTQTAMMKMPMEIT